MILVSACLLGENCKYNGGNNNNEKVHTYLADKEYCPFCPECLGDMTTPRAPIEINSDGKAIDANGEDKSEQLNSGAKKTLQRCRELDAVLVILKDGSPSCGVHKIYDGTFTHKKIPGSGITAKLLKQNDYKIISEDDL